MLTYCRAGNFCQPLCQQQFGRLAVGQQRPVQAHQPLDQPFKLAPAPLAQLHAQIAFILPEDAPRLAFRFEEGANLTARAQSGGQPCQLRRAPLKGQQQAHGIEAKIVHALQLAGHLGRLAAQHGIDQRAEAVLLCPRADGIKRRGIGAARRLWRGIEVKRKLGHFRLRQPRIQPAAPRDPLGKIAAPLLAFLGEAHFTELCIAVLEVVEAHP